MIKQVSALLFVVLTLSGCVTNIYLVRHADRLDNTSDSPLSAAGQIRANALRDTLLNYSIDSVFTTDYNRTRSTAQPLATALNEQLTIYSSDTLALFIESIKRKAGKNFLVVGHSNTVPQMVQILTGDIVQIPGNDFDNLYRVRYNRSIFGNTIRLTELTYGVPSP